jgi:hypothetical protein
MTASSGTCIADPCSSAPETSTVGTGRSMPNADIGHNLAVVTPLCQAQHMTVLGLDGCKGGWIARRVAWGESSALPADPEVFSDSWQSGIWC